MPTYIYRCTAKHTHTLSHSIADCNVRHACPECGRRMFRVPQVVPVNWNGLPPHLEGTRSPAVQNLIDTAPERRARYQDTERKRSHA